VLFRLFADRTAYDEGYADNLLIHLVSRCRDPASFGRLDGRPIAPSDESTA